MPLRRTASSGNDSAGLSRGGDIARSCTLPTAGEALLAAFWELT